MAITLSDVAAAANVSISTASRALKGSSQISPATTALVEKSAAQLGYRPNLAASALRSKHSNLIGLVLNNLVNASFHTIAEVVQRKLADDGYQLILGTTGADAATELTLLDTLGDHGVDGVVIIGTGQHAATTNRFLDRGIAVVNVIRSSRGSAAPTVLAGDRDGAYDATEHLIARGHSRIGYIGGPSTTDSGAERLAGYEAALTRRGLPFDPALVVQGPFVPQFGSAAVTRLLDTAEGMTALFAANHEAVFGMLPTLAARGVRIPEDLSLICYEDMPMLQLWQPPISVVDNGAFQIAELAVDLLLHQVHESTARSMAGARTGRLNRTYRVGAQLLLRQSIADR